MKVKVTIALPLADRVIIRPLERPDKIGSLYIPGSAQGALTEGVVISVGSGRMLESGSFKANQLQPGQRVMYGKYSGAEIEVNGERLWIMREEEVLAILTTKGGD